MYSARSLSLLAPTAAGLWVGGDLGSMLIALVAFVLLVGVGRGVHLRLLGEPDLARHQRRVAVGRHRECVVEPAG